MTTPRRLFKLPSALLFLTATSLTIPAHANSYQPDFGDHLYSSGKEGTNNNRSSYVLEHRNFRTRAGENFEPVSPFRFVGYHAETALRQAVAIQKTIIFSGSVSGGQPSSGKAEIPAPNQVGETPPSNQEQNIPVQIDNKTVGGTVDGTPPDLPAIENIPPTNDHSSEPTPTPSLNDVVPVPEGSPSTGTLMCYVIIAFALVGRRLFGFQLR